MKVRLFTSESVSKGHPDKICDRISDSILDYCLEIDENAKVAIETLVKNNKCIIAGEVKLPINTGFMENKFKEIALKILRENVYMENVMDGSRDFHVETIISKQSNDIAMGVEESLKIKGYMSIMLSLVARGGGSDNDENLIVLCKTCHDLLHSGKITLKETGKVKGMLRHATQMNRIRIQLLKLLPEARETFGFITKEHRQIVGLPKKHFTDAIMIACLNNIGKSGIPGLNFKASSLLVKKCIAKGDYQQTKGIRSEKRIPTGKIQGFRRFDKVRYLGQEYFIKGRMSSGYAVLMDIHGEKVEFKDAPRGMKTPKLANMQRVGARKSWMIQSQKLSQFIS